ncbi:nuclear transport factor 2 family protein [Neorhodopirellula pilleata]|uniref:SnoaL-like domain protein n=1 Tax=Neorhodopirellula pilleata TaxID=2714738 RepID=A0A5C6ANH7_9BACT|nr:nuclear transport factor 2 family protein [Neorhodopirellula pilleata]TWU01593.1 SnoaL-like domain protein [Neorhodopirellula pilleata]
MFKILQVVCLACCWWLGCPASIAVAQSDSDASPPERSAEEQIRIQLRQYVAAFNDRKFDQLADLLSPDLQYRDDSAGTQIDNAEAFLDRLKNAIANEPTLQLDAQSSGVFVENPTKAIVQGSTTLKAADVADEDSYFVLTMSKNVKTWKITSIVEQSPEATLQSAASEAIESLGWLVGTWQDSSPEELQSEIEFLPGRRFLRRTITDSSGQQMLGFEIVGYDPIANRVRSWTYLSDGTFGEGFWTGEENHWSLKMTQTLPDGRAASGTYVLRPENRDTMTVQLVSREIEGEPMPSSIEITMKRIATTPPNTNEPLPTAEAE